MNGIELSERLRAGVPVYALGIRASRTTDVVRWAKAAGYDTIWIDMEHSTLRSGGQHYLAYADHVSGSSIYRWRGEGFEVVQRFDEPGGRAFSFFIEQDALWMVHANLIGETRLFQFDATRIQFDPVQSLGAAGGRELCLVDGAHGRYLVRVCFITGTPHAPRTQQQSQIFLWKQGRFELVDEFPTSGGTDAAAFMAEGQRYVLVSNSLAEDVRFRVDSVLYRFDG